MAVGRLFAVVSGRRTNGAFENRKTIAVATAKRIQLAAWDEQATTWLEKATLSDENPSSGNQSVKVLGRFVGRAKSFGSMRKRQSE